MGAAFAALLAASGTAFAAGYDDFTSGMTANLREDYAAAVTAFTVALAAPDLVPAYKSAAYRGRAEAYLNLDQCDKAKQDLDTHDGLKTGDRPAIRLRLWVNLCLSDTAGARKELDSLAKGKISAHDWWKFARLEWRYGLYDEAVASSREAFKKYEKDSDLAPYVLLWQAMVAHRAGKLDAAEIAAGLAAIDSGWPKPLVDLYLGHATPASVESDAESLRVRVAKDRRCEADFYIAEWHLGRNDTPQATPLLLEAMRSCPLGFIEYDAAKAELKRLGVPVTKE
ncbi:hypothetical protein GCM10008942_18940 [Rhizomicrobium electricum]|jgi:lipoprotein NlpI|uniref:Tetratricopeptide repeat protein n=2 Tax=Rhizomicrobium electricum TaxID=480070 RepID=A0ABN1ENC2_9PROT